MIFCIVSEPCDGSTGTYTDDESIQVRNICKDFLCCGLVVLRRIGRIHKLLWNEAQFSDFTADLLCFRYGAFHPCGSFCQNQFSAIGLDQGSSFLTHGFRHHDDHSISFDSAKHSQSDAGVSTGGLYDDRPLLQRARLFRIFQHAQGRTVLGASGGIHFFKLYIYFCAILRIKSVHFQ